MPYDERLAERIRAVLKRRRSITEKKMFGGLAFMVQGNLACGIVGNDLLVRVGPKGYEDALAREHVRPMDFTGRPMRGMVFVSSEATESDEGLAAWIERGLKFARSLPPK